MDHQFLVSGRVVKGNQLGRTLGFPTINILPDQNILHLIPKGIYAVKVRVRNSFYNGMANLGTRPTLDLHDLVLEVNIFNFSEEIYGEPLTVYFYDFIREEVKFESLEDLKDQIRKDKTMVIKRLSDRPHPDTHP
jgi:riboflavin kinase / FMN adenylyltransferase